MTHKQNTRNFMFEFPCITSLYYIKRLQDATLAVLFVRSLYIFETLPASIIRSAKTVVTAIGACHGSGWCISSKDVQGR